MSFAWPEALLALVLIPLGWLAYRAIDRRQRAKVAAFGGSGAFGSMARTGSAAAGGQGRVVRRWQRLVPSILLVAGLTIMVVALARPQGRLDLPRQEGTVILAFDISASMGATDIAPTRLTAAITAARTFAERQPPSVLVGVVAFSDSGVAVQQPTDDTETVVAAIERLSPQRGTSLGRGILASLTVIAEAAAGPTVDFYTSQTPPPAASPTPVPDGVYAPAIIVLLTDGENTAEPDPLEAAQAAADRGVRVYTVGIGSPEGATLDLDGFQVHTRLDVETLEAIAGLTDATYSGAEDAATLQSIYDGLDTTIVVRSEDVELTPVLAGVALLLLVAGAATSFAWLGRLA